MRTTLRLVSALSLCLLLAAGLDLSHGRAQERQLGPHEHGRGVLNLAIEGTRVSLELEAPGADIVGFEHAARTARQTAALKQAKQQLLAPQALFKFPSAAGCVVAEARVEIEAGEHEHEDAKSPGAGGSKGEAAEDAHSNFHAEYAFNCKDPARITAIEFGYFRTFAGAQKLEVNVITPKGQTKFDVTRDKARIDLAGMM
ncbi:MAG TPA: DUF2796 domain-containing protein [Hyphomicrobiaceae bacterium]|jgi:hypothetical protein|nr:DUF2796 domain-containing protein [Hyphomicrobiaceae bacterium]